MISPTPTSIVDIFRQAAEQDCQISFVDTKDECDIGWRDIWNNAREIAAAMQDDGVGPGDVIAISLPTSRIFAEVYVATAICGALPFVVSMVSGAADKELVLDRLTHLCGQTSATFLVTDSTGVDIASQRFHGSATKSVDYKVWLGRSVEGCQLVHRSWSDAALVQSSSGSTGKPSCLVLSNKNLITNLQQITSNLDADATDCMVSWLPLYHDMGLVGCFLFPTFCQMPIYLMRPMTFLRRPLKLLYEISAHGGTISPSPNFAYDRLISHAAKVDPSKLALHTWKAAMCGAEPINPDTMKDFVRLYSPYGLKPTAFTPCYGMAEATLCISSKPITKLPNSVVHTVHRSNAGVADATTWDLEVVDCGVPVTGINVRIVDDTDVGKPDRDAGRILIDGDSVFDERFVDGERVTRPRGFYDTGDVGFIFKGSLYLTGRLKDIIIINGRNYSAYFFEHVAEGYAPTLTGKTLAFANISLRQEQVRLLVEDVRGLDVSAAAIEAHVAKKTGIRPIVKLVGRNSLPRTTSGKLQRQVAKERYMEVTDEPVSIA
ncbi:hypothetical protein AB833_29105 [Chromatiales bacterium (ex Bugula neritina AB1)]|nr:hypothetical protein AB833_29105 [Chromatiales bacterium (ex Bugula neritina AB1)]